MSLARAPIGRLALLLVLTVPSRSDLRAAARAAQPLPAACVSGAGVIHAGRSAARSHRRATAHRRGVGGGRGLAHARTRARASRGKRAIVGGERRVAALRSGLPNVQALGALVLDENGHELYARSADAERPIASISKLAATLTVMDHGLELEGLSTISKVDIEVARGGARSRLLEGTTLSNRDLLHAALMGSDNRAIPALGRAVGLTPSQLAAAMTAKAKELGLVHTRFHDPTGLSVQNVSTPRETIAMLQAVMRHPVLGPITRRVQYDAHPVGRPPITYVNTYRPAIRGNLEVLGGKTGYNDDARYCLVLAAKVEGKTCFMAFLSNEGKMTRFGDVARVTDWIVARRPPAIAVPFAPTAPLSPLISPPAAPPISTVGAAATVAAPGSPTGTSAWVLAPPSAGPGSPILLPAPGDDNDLPAPAATRTDGDSASKAGLPTSSIGAAVLIDPAH